MRFQSERVVPGGPVTRDSAAAPERPGWIATAVDLLRDAVRSCPQQYARHRSGRTSATRRATLALLLLLASGCSLTETTLADAEDVIIIELILRAGVPFTDQRAFVYRTVGTGLPTGESGARIEVSNAAGAIMTFAERATRECIDDEVIGPLDGTCYVESTSPFDIEPGETYALNVTLRDGRTMTGETTVPGEFEVTRPSVGYCRLDRTGSIELEWRPSDGAWVYIAESTIDGLDAALASEGIEIDEDPLRLIGLSVGREDTTLSFPAEFGLFDRADPDVAEALIAIQGGLPPGVSAGVVIGAADRNYVNWVRGGNFNPSGLVRVSSIRGGGAGVFGAVMLKGVGLTTRAGEDVLCDAG